MLVHSKKRDAYEWYGPETKEYGLAQKEQQ
jgi:hypothetical protein